MGSMLSTSMGPDVSRRNMVGVSCDTQLALVVFVVVMEAAGPERNSTLRYPWLAGQAWLADLAVVTRSVKGGGCGLRQEREHNNLHPLDLLCINNIITSWLPVSH